jgi:Coenzyme F390 synthetase
LDQRFWDRHAETLPKEDIREIQLRRLREVVERVYTNVGFYNTKLKALGLHPSDVSSLSDLVRLPFTTKADIRSNYPFGLLATPKNQVVEVHMSSGTTGVPTPNYLTLKDVENWSEVSARSLTAAGLTREDVFQITPSLGLFTGGFGFFYGARKIGAFIVPTGAGNTKRQVEIMRELGTTSISAIASYLNRLTEVAHEMGVDPARDLGVRRAIIGSEPFSEEFRARMSKTWAMDIYDIPGMTETYGPGMGIDCYLHDGLHIWEDHYLIEVVDPKTGEPVTKSEERGELVVTTLTKDAMPLLRYRTGDITYLYDDGECECGRTHRRIGRISGRVDDMIKFRGVNFWPSYIESLILRHPDLSEEYVLEVTSQSGLDEMILKVESKRILDPAERRRLENELKETINKHFYFTPTVMVVDPKTLPRVEVGKAKRFVDKRVR